MTKGSQELEVEQEINYGKHVMAASRHESSPMVDTTNEQYENLLSSKPNFRHGNSTSTNHAMYPRVGLERPMKFKIPTTRVR